MATRLLFGGVLILLALGGSLAPTMAQVPESALGLTQDSARVLYERAKVTLAEEEREHGRWIETENGPLHFAEWGTSDGIPFLWVHGTTRSCYELFPLLPRLLEMGLRVVAIDWYGHGVTPIPGVEVSVYDVADGMAEVLNSLGMERAIVGGFSNGGGISAAFYDEYPDRTLGLLLEDGGAAMWRRMTARRDPEELRLATVARYQQEMPRYESEFELVYAWMEDQTTEVSVADLVRRLGRPPFQDSEGLWLWRNERYREWSGTDTAEGSYLGLLNPMSSPLFRSSGNLLDPKIVFRNLHVPMLIIDPVSENDSWAATDDIISLVKEHPTLILHALYEDTPHAAKFARPQRFLEDVQRLVERVQTRVGRRSPSDD